MELKALRESKKSKTPQIRVIKIFLVALFVSQALGVSYADMIDDYADAIFKAEGGYKATFLYGIVSVPYKDIHEARQICKNTIINQMRRHKEHIHKIDFLTCLRDRYAPLEAHKLNKHWLKNVRYYYERD